jgi:hypothetical protein
VKTPVLSNSLTKFICASNYYFFIYLVFGLDLPHVSGSAYFVSKTSNKFPHSSSTVSMVVSAMISFVIESIF